MTIRRFVAGLLLALSTMTAWAAVDRAVLQGLASDDNDAKVEAVRTLGAGADASAIALLQALADGEVQAAGERVLIVRDGKATDAATDEALSAVPEGADDIVINNRVRREIGLAMAALRLVSPDRKVRLEAAKALSTSDDTAVLPALAKAIGRESDAEIAGLLRLAEAAIQVRAGDKPARIKALEALAESRDGQVKSLISAFVAKKGDAWAEPDPEIRAAAERSLKAIERNLAKGEWVGQIFSGLSLGSILLLAALGLAITYGLMGVINMAHGELMMLGAYATYVTQALFRKYLPGQFDLYLVAAVPVAFATSAAVGALLERGVIRFLYGRPLETLLATWGISLVLIQFVRTVFGAQNVQVENPGWMSGGFEVASGVVLPYSRIVIIGFAFAVLATMWALLTRTRLGLFVRAVTQNRPMAGCVGVPTPRVDTAAFALGSGVAGLAGCALSQIGNVGPDLGQSYIVDSFMVVVLGGVGQLAGTVYAALGLGVANKFLEAWSGAVLAKICVLLFIILFIQRRPQGLFALKGRAVEA